MDFLPISGIYLRHIRLIKNYFNRVLFLFYWPTLDILMWGFVGKYLQEMQGNANAEMIFILSMLLWAVFARVGMEIFMCLLEEIWSQNVINVFASPITLWQWITLLY
jgi:ABC-2 type transport system permease protein